VEARKRAGLDMTQGSPVRLLILFAIPMWIGGIFQLMYNLVDTIVVGRFVSIDALAAIGAAASTSMFIMFMGNGLTNGLSIIVSQAEGAKQEERLKKAVAHAAYMVLGGGAVLGALSFFGARPLMELLGAPENIIDQSVLYIQITGGLTVIQQAYNGVSSVLRAVGDSKTPLYFLIFSSLLNVGLDLLFVLGFNGGVAGVAFATVLSQLVSAVLCGLYMSKRHKRLVPDRESWRLDKAMIKEYLSIGLPMCAQSMVLCVGMFVITAVINSFGSDIVAAYTVGGKVEQLATVSFSNVAFSFSVYAGQNFGAKKFQRIKEGLRKGLLIVCGLSVVSTAVMLIFARPLALMFMESPSEYVLKAAVSMVRIEAMFFWALGGIWTVNSALRGMGKVKATLVSSIVELTAKIGGSVLLPIWMGYVGIWLSAPIGWVLGMAPSLFILLRWIAKQNDAVKVR
jgi:putative MATE family efflux protein